MSRAVPASTITCAALAAVGAIVVEVVSAATVRLYRPPASMRTPRGAPTSVASARTHTRSIPQPPAPGVSHQRRQQICTPSSAARGHVPVDWPSRIHKKRQANWAASRPAIRELLVQLLAIRDNEAQAEQHGCALSVGRLG